jgi:hypothetical protein
MVPSQHMLFHLLFLNDRHRLSNALKIRIHIKHHDYFAILYLLAGHSVLVLSPEIVITLYGMPLMSAFRKRSPEPRE